MKFNQILVKANLDEKSFFDRITHHLDPEVRKMLPEDMPGNEARIPYSILVHDFAIEINILFPKLTL